MHAFPSGLAGLSWAAQSFTIILGSTKHPSLTDITDSPGASKLCARTTNYLFYLINAMLTFWRLVVSGNSVATLNVLKQLIATAGT